MRREKELAAAGQDNSVEAALEVIMEALKMLIPDMGAMTESVARIAENQDRIIDALNDNTGRFADVWEAIGEIAPERNLIELLADTEEERRQMMAVYMAHGPVINPASGQPL